MLLQKLRLNIPVKVTVMYLVLVVLSQSILFLAESNLVLC